MSSRSSAEAKRKKAGRRTGTVRFALGAGGVCALAYGLWGISGDLGPKELLGLLGWLAAAVVLHDGLLVALTTAAGAGLRRLTFGLRNASQIILRSALLCGAVATLVVVPLLEAQQVARNTSVNEGPYLLSLALWWLGLAVAAGAGITAVELRSRGSAARQPSPSSGPAD